MDDLLQQGITEYKAGNRDEARNIFIAVVKQSPDSESAWGWMYTVSKNDKEQIHCLKQMLRINPKNEKAKQMLDSLTGQDFPFDPPQKVTSPIQERIKNAPPVTQTERVIILQNPPPTPQQDYREKLDVLQKNADAIAKFFAMIAIISFLCLCLMLIII